MARVILGVGAGIAAYKACELLRRLREAGHRVRVTPPPDALRFAAMITSWYLLSTTSSSSSIGGLMMPSAAGVPATCCLPH